MEREMGGLCAGNCQELELAISVMEVNRLDEPAVTDICENRLPNKEVTEPPLSRNVCPLFLFSLFNLYY